MKKFTISMILVFFTILSLGIAQTQIRNLPYFLDYRWHNKPADYVRTGHLKPIPMTEEQLKSPPGPPRIQSQSGVELVNVSNASSHQSEVFIAVNPHNPDNLIVGTNDYRYINSRMVSFYSLDAGNTWKQSITPDNFALGLITNPYPNGSTTTVDPGIAFDSEGRGYYIYLFTQLMKDNSNGDGGIFVCRTNDGGKTWPDEEVGIAVLKYKDALQDKCFIAVDSDPKSPYKNRAYASWFDTKYPFAIAFAYAPNGIDFEIATSVPGSTGKSIQSPLPVVGPNGVLYLTWEEKVDGGAKTKAVVQKSTNGGVTWTWGNPKAAQLVNTCGEVIGYRRALATKGDMRISSHPHMDVDMRNGNIYLIQPGKDENNKYGVFMSVSKDGGETWSGNGSKVENLFKVDGNNVGGDVFLSSISVDPITGMIAVLYYSSQNDPVANVGCDAFVAISFDEGKTFNHIQLTDTWNFTSSSVVDAGGDNLGRYWGDYTSIDVYNGKIYPCFWMPTDKNASFQSCELFTAKLSTAPNPPAELTYENLWQEPTKVKLMWKDPTTNMLGGPIQDFKVIVYRGSEKVAEVDKGVQTYTDNGAVEGQSFSYNLTAKITSTGEESVFATVVGIAGGAIEPKLPSVIAPKPHVNGLLLTWINPIEHVDDTYLYDLNSVEIYVDGSLYRTVSTPQIQAGQQSSELLNLPLEKFYTINLKIKTKRGELVGTSSLSPNYIAYSGAPIGDFQENFDDSENLIPMYLTGDWGLTDKASFSPPYSITDSPDTNSAAGSYTKVIFAPTSISQGNSTLQMKHIGLIRKKDYGSVSISNDFGATYKPIAWIDIDRSSAWDKVKWDVNASEWFEQGIDLSDYVGDTVFVQFALETEANPFNHRDGWFIDDVKIGDYIVGTKDVGYSPKLIDCGIVPNPAVNSTNINFRTPTDGKIFIAVYDELGKMIQVVNDGNLTLGIYNYSINTESLASGFYYIRLSFNGTNEVLPLIIQK